MMQFRAIVTLTVLLAMLPSCAWSGEDRKADRRLASSALPLQEMLRKARTGDKYEMLLRQIKVPGDREKYADFYDFGNREVKEYAGFTGLPAGHWVYVAPYWYIWRDLSATPKEKRAYGPEQATGPPDTVGPGDLPTAWASQTPDNEDEWLLLEYAEPIVPATVLVHETFNPGAVNRVTVFRLDGEEVEVWKGKDPTPATSTHGVSEIAFKVGFKTNRVKIYIDSKNVPGWNEIDAVGLRDTSGKTHWAKHAEASSTFAAFAMPGPGIRGVLIMPAPIPPALPPLPAAAVPDNKEERIKKLEKEVKELKDTVKALQDHVKKEKK